jgi:hypothetical protein
MKSIFIQLILANIRLMAIDACTADNIEIVLKRAFDALQAYAKNTNTTLDDWLVKTLATYVATRENAEILESLAKGLLADAPASDTEPTPEQALIHEIQAQITPKLVAWEALAK